MDEALRIVEEIERTVRFRSPGDPCAGLPRDLLPLNDVSLTQALRLGLVREEVAPHRTFLYTTGLGRDMLRRNASPWWQRVWDRLLGRRRTIRQWERKTGVRILDPDGFDRRDPLLYRRPLTWEEFSAGLAGCTVGLPAAAIREDAGHSNHTPDGTARGRGKRAWSPKKGCGSAV